MVKFQTSFAHGCLDTTLLREFCSYDILCPECCELVPEAINSSNYMISKSRLTSLHWSRQYEYTWAILNSNLKPTDICLDAGGGYSVFKYAIAKRCQKVITIDVNQDYLDKTIKSADRMGFKNIEFLNCAIENYQTNQKIDKIYCLSVIEHIKDKDIRFKCLSNMLNLIDKNGEFYLTFDVVMEPGNNTFDFYINRQDASEILQFLGINGNVNGEFYTGVFPGGCVLVTVCIKMWDF